MNNSAYYVYLWVRKKDNVPYYVGKGTGNRAYRNKQARVVIYRDSLTEQEAWDLEKQLISKHKRTIDGGTLINRTLGGNGGWSEVNSCPELIEKAERARRSRFQNNDLTERQKRYKEKRIEACKKGLRTGIPQSQELKEYMSSLKKELYLDKTKHPMWGKTTYVIISPTGEKYIISGGFKQWCDERGLNNSNLTAVAKGKRKHHKGWTAVIVND